MATTRTKAVKASTSDPVAAARTAVAEGEKALAEADEKLSQLRKEQADLTRKVELGDLSIDPDRIEELDRLLPAREARRDDIRDRILPARRQALASAELTHLADQTAEGSPAALLSSLEGSKASAVEKLTAAIEELHSAVEGYNQAVRPLVAQVREAGLIEGKTDPLARVLVRSVPVARPNGGTAYTDVLVVDGELYREQDPQAIAAAVLAAVTNR
ncbi:hypothetical protein [Brachybacterium hainanense]|uniref:Uncharacterized protein n=1 Tax=Brachybacterium hainanense TaxID=1541174 RepID=A0ABV6RAJ3_9MICO